MIRKKNSNENKSLRGTNISLREQVERYLKATELSVENLQKNELTPYEVLLKLRCYHFKMLFFFDNFDKKDDIFRDFFCP